MSLIADRSATENAFVLAIMQSADGTQLSKLILFGSSNYLFGVKYNFEFWFKKAGKEICFWESGKHVLWLQLFHKYQELS